MKIKEKIFHTINAILRHLIIPIFIKIPIRGSEDKDVVIIRTDGIGDFVMWAGSLCVYRNYFEERKITFICPSNYVDLVNRLDIFDEIITINKKLIETNLFYQIKFIYKLKKMRADIVINPVKSRMYPSDYLVQSIHSNNKVGFYKGVNNRYNKDKYYSSLVEIPSCCHEMKATELFTKRIVGEQYIHKLADFSHLFENKINTFKRPYCVVALSSTDERKIWEIEKVSKVISKISNKYAIVLTGCGKKDEERAQYIKLHLERDKVLYDYVGKTSIYGLVQIVAGASIVLGNDSSTVHISAACRVPSICYMTGATYNQFLPYPIEMDDIKYHPKVVVKAMDCFGCWYNCKEDYGGSGPLKCLKDVSVDMVLHELNTLEVL